MDKELSRTVIIHTKEFDGVGIIIEEKEGIIIVTSPFHVVEGWNNECYVIKSQKVLKDVNVIGFCKDKDIAFLEISGGEDLAPSIDNSDINSTDNVEILKSSPVHIYDLMNNNQRYDGEVVEPQTYLYDLEQSMMLLKVENHEGMSGTPVFDEKSEIIGMIIAGNGTDAGALSYKEIIEEYCNLLIAK